MIAKIENGGEIEVSDEEDALVQEYHHHPNYVKSSYFDYMLLYPRKLPTPFHACTFPQFLSALFYIGKGIGDRYFEIVDEGKVEYVGLLITLLC